MHEDEKVIQRAQLVLPGGILNAGTLKGGQITKVSTLYSAFFMIVMELHLALIDWIDNKSSAIFDRLIESESYQKLKDPVIKEASAPKTSAIAESSFVTLNPSNQNLIMALAELNLMRTRGEDQLLTGLGSSCYKYAVQASECLEEESASLARMEKTQKERIDEMYPLCVERIFGSRIALVREKAMQLKIPGRPLASTCSLEAIREAINYGIGTLKCKPVPEVSLIAHPIDQSNIERRTQKHLNNTELEKTIANETNPILLAEKLKQLNVVNVEIDKSLAFSTSTMFEVSEKATVEAMCAGLVQLQKECLELCAETLMLKEKLMIANKQDFRDQVQGAHDQSMACLQKSASQLKGLNEQIDANRQTLELRVDSLEKVFLDQLSATNNKTEKYNIGVCQRAITKALSQTKDFIEINALNTQRKNIAILIIRITEKIRTLVNQ